MLLYCWWHILFYASYQQWNGFGIISSLFGNNTAYS